MNSEGKFWIRVWGIVASGLSIVTICITTLSIYKTHKIEEMVKNGTNPTAAYCAVSLTVSKSRCLLYVGLTK
tara:strand:+ start:1030 stop:1245 length:216 start_codon:yes stop_codon:yes gene_type:complete